MQNLVAVEQRKEGARRKGFFRYFLFFTFFTRACAYRSDQKNDHRDVWLKRHVSA